MKELTRVFKNMAKSNTQSSRRFLKITLLHHKIFWPKNIRIVSLMELLRIGKVAVEIKGRETFLMLTGHLEKVKKMAVPFLEADMVVPSLSRFAVQSL